MNQERQKYNEMVSNINKLLRSEQFYDAFQKKLKASRPKVALNKKKRTKTFDLEWIEMIEKSLVNLDNIVRNPRKFIVQEEDIVDISLARAISTESVKHLAQHTNFISSVDKDGMVTPNKILNVTKEESFEVYENRFIYTLLRNLNNFITRRLDAIKAAYVNDNVIELDIDDSVFTGKTRVFYKLELVGSLPNDDLNKRADQADSEGGADDIEILERISKMQKVVGGFLGSPFAKQMQNSAPVRPPITRTNVILKNPDFKQALVLWQFVEGYTKMGFSVDNDVKKLPIDEIMQTNINDMVYLGAMLMEGMIEGTVEDTAFFQESIMDETNYIEKVVEVEKKDDKEQENAEQEGQEQEKAQNEEPEEKEDNKGEVEIEEAFDENILPDEDERLENQDKDDEEDEDEKYVENIGSIDESRNMFHRTSEETTLTKAEMTRINKALDRVLARQKEANAHALTESMKDQENISQEKLREQLEKERAIVQRNMERRAKALEREKQAQEKLAQEQQERLKALEDALKNNEAEKPKGTLKNEDVIED